MLSDRLICKFAASLLLLAVAITASAQEFRLQPLNLDEIGELRIVEGTIRGDGTERQILFEGGAPVATNSTNTLSFETAGDLFLVRVGGERYEIPEAVVNGG